MTTGTPVPRSGAQMLERAMAVLACFEARPSVGVSEAARTLGLSVSTTHRLLKTLCTGGLLMQDGSGRYRLGPRTALLGALATRRLGFDAALPLLERLAADTGGAVTLGVLDAGAMLTVMTVESPLPDGVTVPYGARNPLHACAMGKSVVAFTPDLDLVDALPKVTERTITDLSTLAGHLSEVRARGWALNEGELSAGIRGVGAPIIAADGRVAAAVAVAVPRSRTPDEVPTLARHVRRSAADLRSAFSAAS